MQSNANIAERVRQVGLALKAELEPVAAKVSADDSDERLYPQVAKTLDHCLADLAELNFWGVGNRVPSSELWNIAGPILERGWLQNRARTKPRGYAGDYEMLARIYEGTLCDDPLGRLFDRYFQEQAAPVAALAHELYPLADVSVCQDGGGYDRVVRVLT